MLKPYEESPADTVELKKSKTKKPKDLSTFASTNQKVSKQQSRK